MGGHVVVLGIGDTAMDCARSAFRLGAERVTLCFRKGFQDLRANDEIFEPGRMEGLNFIPYSAPVDFITNDQGQVTALEFEKNFPVNNDPNDLQYERAGFKFQIKCDHVVTAFGCQLPTDEEWMKQIKTKRGQVEVDYYTNRSKSFDWLYVGGDAIGTKNLVDAVNDGKTAAWFMHKQIQEKEGFKVSDTPQLPGFFTPIDLVDLSTEICGVKMSNPFGLASAPPTTSYPMIRRAFEVGWDFAVVKTFVLDKDAVTNVSPRIYKTTNDPLQLEPSFGNIELISEKTAEYWVKGAKEIKKDFPEKILIGSVMASFNENDWKELAHLCNEAGFDLVELNLSCPHGMNEKGMGRACGEDPAVVEQITRWFTSISNVPAIIKITPNYGQAEVLAEAAYRGGAKAVTTTNTMPGLIDPKPSGEPLLGVGREQLYGYGGTTGSILRPQALRKTSEVAKTVPIEIFGSGGIISGDHALAYLHYGAKALQVCSAVQNLDAATVIFDLKTSLQAHMYLLNDDELKKKGWSGQFPPKNFTTHKTVIDGRVVEVPNILELVGKKLNHVSLLDFMKREVFLVPEINDSKCLQCGRCYLACADSGYQAIKFDGFSTIPQIVEKDCTGCAICHSVCPVEDAIHMVPRKSQYNINRGTEPSPNFPREHLKPIDPPSI